MEPEYITTSRENYAESGKSSRFQTTSWSSVPEDVRNRRHRHHRRYFRSRSLANVSTDGFTSRDARLTRERLLRQVEKILQFQLQYLGPLLRWFLFSLTHFYWRVPTLLNAIQLYLSSGNRIFRHTFFTEPFKNRFCRSGTNRLHSIDCLLSENSCAATSTRSD